MLAYKYVGDKSEELLPLKDELNIKSKEAEFFQEIRIGEEFLFHRSFIRTKYLYIDEISTAFLRVESGESGDFPTQAVYLILQLSSGREISFHMERYDTAKKMFSYLQERFPKISYGFTK